MHVDTHGCPQNHSCPAVRFCPTGAIEQNGNGLPLINKGKCIECGACIDFCPMGAIRQ
ncbi:MAG: 4Fe-4S binding protein [Spirochaetes bacterium]|nr:4Fe-4S binding protein [Spirochaetota bacterium]